MDKKFRELYPDIANNNNFRSVIYITVLLIYCEVGVIYLFKAYQNNELRALEQTIAKLNIQRYVKETL